MTSPNFDQTGRVRFGAFELDLRSGELWRFKEGDDAPRMLLQEQPFQILRILINLKGSIATREDIKGILWPDDRTVDFNHSINVAIATLRKTLGDSADEPRYIETVTRRGYRLIPGPEVVPNLDLKNGDGLPVSTEAEESVPTGSPPAAAGKILSRRVRAWLGAAVPVALVGGAIFFWHSRQSVHLVANDTVVLADISNQTSDPVFDDALNTALRVEFEQTPYFGLLAPDKVWGTMKELHRPEAEKITQDNALEVCRRTNSRAVIASSIADQGNRFRIELRGVDCSTGREFAKAAEVVGNRNDIVHSIGVLGEQLRRKMGEPRASLERFSKPLDIATSSSLEALQLLTSGYRLHLARDPHAATYYQQAIGLDSKLALAYIALGAWDSNFSETTAAATAERKAFELRDRLTGPNRFLAETLYYDLVTGELEKSLPVYLDWVRTYPLDARGHLNLSFCALKLGRLAPAVMEAREAARLLPSPATYGQLMVATIVNGEWEAARDVFHKAEQQGFEDVLRGWRSELAFLEHDQTAMKEQLVWAEDTPAGLAGAILYAQANADAYFGRMRSASQWLARAKEKSAHNDYGAIPLGIREEFAVQQAEVGNTADALKLLPSLAAEAKDRDSRLDLAMLLARVGEVEKAKNLADTLNREYPQDTLAQKYSLPMVRAAIQLHENNPAGAIESLRPAEKYELAVPDTVNSVYPAYLRGLAYLQTGNGVLATPEFQKVIDHPGVVGRFVTGALARLQLARAQKISGDQAAAQKSYEDFLRLWQDADGDIATYREAKIEYSKLK
jgi:eukaryotic-like serine/threonine-protein kinase